MSQRTMYERVEEIRGFKYIRLKSGRRITYMDATTAADRAFTDLTRAISRAFKLVDGDWDLTHLEWKISHLEEYVGALRAYIDKLQGVRDKRERIALLRNTTGRTPEEARLFRLKADELERELDS